MPGKLRVTQVKSRHGRLIKQQRTLDALGLRHIRHSVVHRDTPQIRGMLQAISFLVKVEEV